MKNILAVLEEIKNTISCVVSKEEKSIFNEQNLELESYEIDVTSAGQLVPVNANTKIEHGKILGVFVSCRGTASANYNSLFSVEVDNVRIISNDDIHFQLFEKTAYNNLIDVAWKTDIDISTSNVRILYKDGSNITPPYKAYVHFICRKK